MTKRVSHGVMTTKGNSLKNVVNIRSKKNIQNNRIRLDKLMKSSTPKILIKRRLGGIGDVIMSTPLLKHIKRLIPNCELTYATDLDYSWGALGECIKHNPYVDILVGNKEFKESDYDYSVDITATGLSREKAGSIPPNRIDMFAEEVGIDVSSDPKPDWIVTEDEKTEAIKFAAKYIPKGKDRKDYKLVMIQCRSNDARRTWPLNHVDTLADMLAEDENTLVFLMEWGSNIDRWENRTRVHVIADQPLKETAAFMQQCDLVICPDSALLHLAGALGKKTVTIFGPIPPQSRINHYPNCEVVYRHLPCSFCWYTPRCNKNTGSKLECLTKIMPETVHKAAIEKMKAPDKTMQSIPNGSELTPKGQDNIILIRRQHGGMGDILMTGPALKALKSKFPDKAIHYAIPKIYHKMMANLPFIDRVLDVLQPIDYKKYFMTMDISNPDARYESARIMAGKRVEKSRVEIYAEAIGVRDLLVDYTPIYLITKEETQWADTFLKSQKIEKDKPIIGIQLESAEEYRNYPEPKFKRLIELLRQTFNVVIFGSEKRKDYEGTVDTCGFSIRELGAVLSLCDIFISVDTGPLHLAAALDITTVALFGPIDYRARCKGYSKVVALVAELDCVPCWRNCEIACKQTKNVKGYSKCMDSIPPSVIANVANQKLKEINNA